MANEAYLGVSNSVLENIVVMKKNSDYKEEETTGRKKIT